MKESALDRRWVLLACFLAAAVLFFFANRAAYKGYFSDDDLDNLTWPTYVGNDVYWRGLATLKFDPSNFRPVGDFYYRYVYRAFHLNYIPYVIVIQLIHGLNVVLLFFLLRRLDFSSIAAGAGALFYSFHAAVLEIYWKPMYVFDLLCATLCLITLLMYLRGRWLLALIPFWLAFKSKELAVAVPVVLLAWEWFFGQRKWKRLIPYFLISLNFGLQALWANRSMGVENAYRLHFAGRVFWQSIEFYSSAIFFFGYALLVLAMLPIWIRDRRLYFGLIAMLAWLLPLIALPGRQAAVYWYVPMIGLAIVIAAIAARTPKWAILLLFLIWIPANFALLREKRPEILAEGRRTRALLAVLREYSSRVPPLRAVVYKNMPDQVHAWGMEGAITQVFGNRVQSAWSETADAKQAMAKFPMAVIQFHEPPLAIQGLVRVHDGPQPYVRFTDLFEESQFGAGWFDQGSLLRWTAPQAEATFHRTAGAKAFEIVAGMSPDSLKQYGPSQVTVLEDGQPLGTQVLSEASQTLRWSLGQAAPGDKHITIVSKPARRGEAQDPRVLGIAVRAIGYTAL